jgi:hypothetical protein
LRKENIDKIVKIEIDVLIKRLTKMKYNFTYDSSIIDLISKVGFDETYGARPLKRAIQDKIEDLISEKILLSEVIENSKYKLILEGDEIKIEPTLELETVTTEPKKKGRKKKGE